MKTNATFKPLRLEKLPFRGVTMLAFITAIRLACTCEATIIHYTHDSAGRLTLATYTNGNAHAYTYDNAGNLLQRANLAPGTSVTPDGDSDGDGLPDAWEQQYFGDLSRNGTGDYDNDGFTDSAEFLLGTSPTDPNSGLRIIPPPLFSGSGVTIVWTAVPGKTYRLQYRNAIGNPSWTDVAGDVTATGATAQNLDPTALGQPTRFYRVALVSSGVSADSDGDGLLDSWEQQYFGDLSRNGTGDFDNDGASDLAEFLAGTDPTSSASVLRITHATVNAQTTATVEWTSVAGKNYRVQYKDSLSAPTWTDLSGDVMATGPIASKVDPTIAGVTQRLYRVALVTGVTSPLSPVLSVARTNNQLLVSWPSSTPVGFSLETTTNLVPVVVWSPVTNEPSNNGTNKTVILNLTPFEPSRFYRLRQ